MATDSFLSRIARRFCAWIVRRGAEERPVTVVITPLITQPGEDTESSIPVFDLTSKVVDDNTIVRSDGSSGDPLHAARYEHGLWKIAWSDGRLGVNPDAQNELIRAQATITRQTRIARVRAELENAQAAENFRKEDYWRARSDWEGAKKEHDDVSAQQRRDPAGFSRLVPWLYIAFALAILVADLPLSLLVAKSLGVDVRTDARDLVALLQDWSKSWDAIAVSLGVAALTIAFKLVIDRLYVRDDESESRAIRYVRATLRITVLVTATLATISAFFVIGRVRAFQMTSKDPNAAIPFEDLQYLFTVLAILFPVVAAYCLSMARLCWQNAKRLRLAAKARDKAWHRFRLAQEPYEATQAARSAVESRLRAMSLEQIDEMFLRELYTHAFDRGWAVPETRLPTASLYDRCERLMHRALARIEQLDNA
jgi:hypothetical protein